MTTGLTTSSTVEMETRFHEWGSVSAFILGADDVAPRQASKRSLWIRSIIAFPAEVKWRKQEALLAFSSWMLSDRSIRLRIFNIPLEKYFLTVSSPYHLPLHLCSFSVGCSKLLGFILCRTDSLGLITGWNLITDVTSWKQTQRKWMDSELFFFNVLNASSLGLIRLSQWYPA